MIREPRRILRAVAGQPWAILESKGEQIWELLELRSRGELRSDAEVQAAMRGRREKVIGQSSGVMVIPVFGVLAHRMSAFEESSGGTSVEKLKRRIHEAITNEDVGTIVLQVDSPGGSVSGLPELASKIFEARGDKRIIAVADPMMASGAYWIASAADEVVVTPSGMVGSIGVVSVHAEFSRAQDDAGISVTVIRSGRYKAEANAHEPLTDEAHAHIQQTADDYYALFVDAVAAHRGVDPDDVRNGFGEGRVLTAQRAVGDGLADRVATLEEVLDDLGVSSAQLAPSSAEPAEAPAATESVAGVDVGHSDTTARVPDPGLGGTVVRAGARPPTLLRPECSDGSGHDTSGSQPDRSTAEDGVQITIAGAAATREQLQALAEDAATRRSKDTKADEQTEQGGADGAASTDVQDHSPDTEAPSGQEDTMAPKTGTGPQDGAENRSGGATATVERDHQAERSRAAQISDICAAVGIGHRAGEFIESGESIEQIRETVRAEAEQNLRAMTAPAVEMSDREVRRYSLTRAIMTYADKGESWDGFEREVSDQIRKDLPENYKPRGGIFVPVRRTATESDRVAQGPLLVQRLEAMVREQAIPTISKMRLLTQIDQMKASLESTTAAAGGDIVFTQAGDFIDLLRSRMKVAELGATILTGLQGPVAFPKQSAAGTFEWVGEDPGTDQSDSDLTLAQVALNPKAGQSTTAYTRQLLAQGVVDVDNLVKMDLALITALGIDAAGISGSGADNEPTGVLNTTGIGSVEIDTNGGAPTYPHMVDLETEVATDNADIGSMAYLTTPGVRGELKKTEEFAGSNGRPVWTGGMEGEANGYPAHVSTQVPSDLTKGTGTNLHAILFGVWSQLMIGYWGAYELVVDPYSKKKQGLIELTSFQMAGIAVRHPESFAAVEDADPQA